MEKIATWIVAAVLFLLIVAIPYDIVNFYNEKEMYAMVHHLDQNQPDWEWQYVKGSIYGGIFVLMGLTIIILRLIKRNNRIIRIANVCFLLFFFGLMFLGYYKWMKTGFDH